MIIKKILVIALIYVRVSTKKQDPLSQIIRCEEYCKQKGYVVEKCFQDKYTGGGNFMERPAMRELLEYAKKNPHKRYVIVFDDLKRFARDTQFHLDLRTTFTALGLTPECLNYNFDDSPEGRYMETVFAAQNELERHQNRRQVIQKQQARLIAGYNAFVPPTGYKKIKKHPVHGTIDVPNHHASAMKRALKMFAYGELQNRIDVATFLKQEGVLGKQEAFRYLETVKGFLTNVFYAGYIEYLPWEVERRKGHHKPLITLKEYNLIQDRLFKTDHSKPIRKDINPEYPLRGFINCYYCKMKLTACKSRGRWGGLYHKYYCRNRNCPLRNMAGIKSVSRDDLHLEFQNLLKSMCPSSEVFTTAIGAFQQMLKEQSNTHQKHKLENEKEKQQIQEEIDTLVSIIANPKTTAILRGQYEKKVTHLAERLEKISITNDKNADVAKRCRTPLIKILEALKDPYKTWLNCELTQKRKLFYFLFEENLEYQPKVGFRTPKKALPIRLFERFSDCDSGYVKIPRNCSNPLVDYITKWNTQIRPMLDNKNH